MVFLNVHLIKEDNIKKDDDHLTHILMIAMNIKKKKMYSVSLFFFFFKYLRVRYLMSTLFVTCQQIIEEKEEKKKVIYYIKSNLNIETRE